MFAGVAEPTEGERDGAAGVGGGGDVRLLRPRPRQGAILNVVRQLGGLPKLKDRKANPHMNIPMGPQEKYQFNTARPKAVNVLRSVFNFGLARDKLALNSIAVAV